MAADMVCQASVAHLTRMGNARTPESTCSRSSASASSATAAMSKSSLVHIWWKFSNRARASGPVLPRRMSVISEAEAIGLGAALDYVEGLGRETIAAHESGILAHATARLGQVPGLTIIGTAREKASIVSFTMACAHAHDIGTVVDRAGVALRTGHHCAQPLLQRFGLTATARASFGIYNTREEVDVLVEALGTVTEIFGKGL